MRSTRSSLRRIIGNIRIHQTLSLTRYVNCRSAAKVETPSSSSSCTTEAPPRRPLKITQPWSQTVGRRSACPTVMRSRIYLCKLWIIIVLFLVPSTRSTWLWTGRLHAWTATIYRIVRMLKWWFTWKDQLSTASTTWRYSRGQMHLSPLCHSWRTLQYNVMITNLATTMSI